MEKTTTTLKRTFHENLNIGEAARKKFRWFSVLIGTMILMMGTGNIYAQEYESLLLSDSIFNDTLDHLIITEWRGDSWSSSYIELTNMGDSALDLRKFTIRSLPGGKDHWDFDGPNAINDDHAIVMDSLQLSVDEYTLEPGEVFLMAPHYDELTADGKPQHRPELVEMVDYIGYKIEGIPDDQTSYGERFFRQWKNYPVGVFVATRVTDTIAPFYKQGWVLVDNINGDIDPETGEIGAGIASVAGFPEATGECVLVRKHTVTKGTRQDGFSEAASNDIGKSEWIPIKHDDSNPGGKVFKTAGNHGNFVLEGSVTGGPGVTIDLANRTLEVPWGALRGERIIDNEVLLGDGMAWTYRNYSEEGDSLLDINDWSFNQIAMPGDVLSIYACGDELDSVNLTISYAAYADDIVKAYATYRMNALGEWVGNYYVTDEAPVIDTIGNVPYATRIDTLMKYIDIAPNSSHEFVFWDNEDRVDLQHGDKLKVIGADGTTIKEYFIDVQDYEGSSEARLSTITWPDLFLQGANMGFYMQNGWISGAQPSDTLPEFSASKLTYIVKLAKGTTDVPAFAPTPMHLNASIQIDRATDLNGSVEDRTTTITVTAENGEISVQYSILFEVFADEFQTFSADPFFSTIMHTINTRNAGLELVNPGNVPLNLSNYLILKTNKTVDWESALQDTMSWEARYNKYVPGYVYKAKNDTAWSSP